MSRLNNTEPSDEWVPPQVILSKLNLSRNKLQQLRNQGVFSNGIHWIDINPLSSPRYRYHLENCKQRLKQLRKENDRFSGK